MKKLVLVVLIALIFSPTFQSVSHAQPSITEFNSCVNFFTRKLSVRENRCRWFEFEVEVGNGSGNGGGNENFVTVSNSAEYTSLCNREINSSLGILLFAECPVNTILVGSSCDVNPQVPLTNESVILRKAIAESSDSLNLPYTTIAQSISCVLFCEVETLEFDITGSLTATAVCAEL